MKSQEPHGRDRHNRDRMERADPKALATARELALLLPNDAVMLFGSRAGETTAQTPTWTYSC